MRYILGIYLKSLKLLKGYILLPMTAKKKKHTSTLVPIKYSTEELAIADWLKKKTTRTRAGAIKWATEKAAIELGYKPPKVK
jgi:hypothetical protein